MKSFVLLRYCDIFCLIFKTTTEEKTEEKKTEKEEKTDENGAEKEDDSNQNANTGLCSYTFTIVCPK